MEKYKYLEILEYFTKESLDKVRNLVKIEPKLKYNNLVEHI
jgi:hypothetical protein